MLVESRVSSGKLVHHSVPYFASSHGVEEVIWRSADDVAAVNEKIPQKPKLIEAHPNIIGLTISPRLVIKRFQSNCSAQ